MTTNHVSRRHFIGGAAAATALGTLGVRPEALAARELRAAERGIRRLPGGAPMLRTWQSQTDAYDALAHLSSNENPFGPSDKTIEAMTYAFKYSMRYGYPDNNVQRRIADAHGVPADHVLDVLAEVGLQREKDRARVDPRCVAIDGSVRRLHAHHLLVVREPGQTDDVEDLA
jgi:hypothetical protein